METLGERRLSHPMPKTASMVPVMMMIVLDIDDGGRGANEGKDAIPALGVRSVILVGRLYWSDGLDQRQTEGFTECIGDFHGLRTKTSFTRATDLAT